MIKLYYGVKIGKHYKFDRMELSGSLGDLGTLLPLALGMILLNGISATGTLFMVGVFYILSGIYFKVPTPVQPMKVIGAYAIANYDVITPNIIYASALLIGMILVFLGITGLISLGKYVPKTVVRGVQISVGTALFLQGLRFILSPPEQHIVAEFQLYLHQYSFFGISLYFLIGIIALIITFILLENRKLPAALIIVIMGFIIGLIFGKPQSINIGINLPEPIFMSTNLTVSDFLTALFLLVIPQLPMTIGNAIIAQHDLAKNYFGERAKKVTYKSLSISQGLADIASFILKGMPMCHGAGGLAAHYKFGARTAGNNIIIGSIFLAIAIMFGEYSVEILKLIPFSILGVLLFFAGAELMTMIKDLKDKKEFFIALAMLGITLISNLAYAFFIGLLLHYLIIKKGLFKV